MHLRLISTAGALGLGLALAPWAAQALPFTSTIDPTPDVVVTASNFHTFQHVITPFFAGDQVTSALLSVVLSDEGGAEDIRFNIEGTLRDRTDTGDAPTAYSFDLGPAELDILTVMNDGVLNVTLSIQPGGSGSYLFSASTLTGETDRQSLPDTAVPAPAVLGIFGLALVLLGSLRRRRPAG